MRYILLISLWVLVSVMPALAQDTLRIRVLDADNATPLAGANILIQGTDRGTSSDLNGMAVLPDMEHGSHTLVVSFVGYETREVLITLPFPAGQVVSVLLREEYEELEEVAVTTTRGSRTISDSPTRIEVITEEELDENAAMNSANIAMLLRETAGIQRLRCHGLFFYYFHIKPPVKSTKDDK